MAPSRLVTRETVGAPEGALLLLLFPIAPEPLTPEVSAPVKVMTVMEAATLCERAARTLTLLSVELANALHTSAVPSCALARRTSAQVNPAPLTPVTVIPAELP